jgi:hypothetical protein
MWVYCKSGFFSAVNHATKKNMVHVRARFEGDLERLCEAHAIKAKVDYTPENDYAWRMNFTKTDWARIMEEESMDIDYTNFKNAVHDGTERDWAYMNVWSVMRGAQRDGVSGAQRIRR